MCEVSSVTWGGCGMGSYRTGGQGLILRGRGKCTGWKMGTNGTGGWTFNALDPFHERPPCMSQDKSVTRMRTNPVSRIIEY